MQSFFILIQKFAEEDQIAASRLAVRCGLHESYFRKLRDNDGSPTLRVIQKICAYKNMTLQQFGGMLDELTRSGE